LAPSSILGEQPLLSKLRLTSLYGDTFICILHTPVCIQLRHATAEI
jgi:hypothetical protein